MKSPKVSKKVAALWLLLSLYAPPAPAVRAADPPVATPGAAAFRLVRERLVVVRVRVNGAGPFDFLLDTGTTTTLVEPELAALLGLRARDRLTLVTVAGERALPRVGLASVALGDAEAAEVEALVAELDAVRALDRRVRGVLGQNFLANFDYALDYARRRVEFDRDGPAWRGPRVPFARDEGRLVVSAGTRAGAGGDLRMVLDAAATECVIFAKGDGPGPPGLSFQGAAHVRTETGGRPAALARLRALHVGGERISDLTVAVLPGPPGSGLRAEDGLLPTSLFRAVYFNHTEGYVIFNPKKP